MLDRRTGYPCRHCSWQAAVAPKRVRAVHEACDAAGLNGDGQEKVGLHDLRHSLVAIALASGMSLPETAALARHANPQVTVQVCAGLTGGSVSDTLISQGPSVTGV
ncbi:MAG: hypothetical protein ACXVZ1_04500 [Gaiellaceae bacterium]